MNAVNRGMNDHLLPIRTKLAEFQGEVKG